MTARMAENAARRSTQRVDGALWTFAAGLLVALALVWLLSQ